MPAQLSFPGVYIEEFAPGAPIEGVGTSTAALLGPSSTGPLNEPTRITSWDAFKNTFGSKPLHGFYLWYAARGFFENGGTNCYVTRVSNATYNELVLLDQQGHDAIRIRSRTPGAGSISVTTADVNAVSGGALFKPEATVTNASGTAITVDDADAAASFRPEDVVVIDDGTQSETASVLRVEGATVRLAGALSQNYGGATLRLADVESGDIVFRASDAGGAGGLASGSAVELSQGGVSETAVVDRVTVEKISSSLTTYRVVLRSGLANSYDLAAGADDVAITSFETRLTVDDGTTSKEYDALSMDPEHPSYYRRIVNEDPSGMIYADPVEPPNVAPAPGNRPQAISSVPLTGGGPDDPGSLTATDYKNALKALEVVDDVNILACPDRTDVDVQLALIAHCESLYDRFAILDARRGAPAFGTDSVEIHRSSLDTENGFAALYYPWIQVASEAGDETILVPPSGHVAGTYARTDARRGVHKAPAGSEALLSGALGVETSMTDVDHGVLNLQGINVIRTFRAGGRPVLWGARTTATNTNWQYVNIRRLFLYIEESIEEGIRWAVFEPNDLALWQKLKRTITEFLKRAWRDGALFGATPEEAFYVRIDEAINPVSERALGRLYIEVGICPVFPAEFIIVRIGIWEGGSEVSEA